MPASQVIGGTRIRAVATNASGQAVTEAVTLSVDPGTARLVNVSARTFVSVGDLAETSARRRSPKSCLSLAPLVFCASHTKPGTSSPEARWL
jgi:hypothetical protein